MTRPADDGNGLVDLDTLGWHVDLAGPFQTHAAQGLHAARVAVAHNYLYQLTGIQHLEWFDGGNDEVFNLENGQGSVKIETVTDTELTGSIDVTGDNGFMVKGPFKAERVPAK